MFAEFVDGGSETRRSGLSPMGNRPRGATLPKGIRGEWCPLLRWFGIAAVVVGLVVVPAAFSDSSVWLRDGSETSSQGRRRISRTEGRISRSYVEPSVRARSRSKLSLQTHRPYRCRNATSPTNGFGSSSGRPYAPGVRSAARPLARDLDHDEQDAMSSGPVMGAQTTNARTTISAAL